MRKEFKIGMPLESNTEYFATNSEYHIYAKDAAEVCDGRYIALRAHDTKEFKVFVFIKEKKNITLDFCGATLVLHGKILPFLIDSCENVTVKNCNVTYDRPHYTEALITDVTPEYARLRLNESCPCRIEDGKLVPYCDSWENHRLNHNGCFYQAFDAETREGRGLSLAAMGNHPIQDPECKFAPRRIYTVEKDGEDILLKGNIPVYYKPNTVLVIEHELRSLASVFAIDTKGILIENYRILSGCGMGIYTYRVENITIDGLRLTHDEKSPCIVTNSADAVHSFGTSGKFEIRNCVFEGMIDDAINIHSNFRTVLRTDGNSIYTDLASCEMEANELYRVGDEIAIYRGHTMEETARHTVLGIEDVDARVKRFTVDRPVATHAEGDLIECLTSNCDVTIENCIFGKANSHMRFQSRGKFIMRNCESELPILLSGDANFWFESGPITDLTVENCRFIGERGKIQIFSEVDSSEAAPYYHKNLKILNNEFDAEVPVKGGTSDGILFKGNRNRQGRPMKLVLTGCGDVDATDCEVEKI